MLLGVLALLLSVADVQQLRCRDTSKYNYYACDFTT